MILNQKNLRKAKQMEKMSKQGGIVYQSSTRNEHGTHYNKMDLTNSIIVVNAISQTYKTHLPSSPPTY